MSQNQKSNSSKFQKLDLQIPFEFSSDMDPSQSRIFHDVEIESQVVLSKSIETLNLFGTNLKRLHSEIHTTHNTSDEQIKNSKSESLSTLNIMKLARAQLLELNSKNVDVFSITVAEEIDVAIVLQASAQQVAKKRFISARKLLSKCQSFASQSGTPFQRVVFYFAEALYDKMDQDWGFIKRNELEANTMKKIDALHTLLTLQPARISCEQDFSTSVVCQYTSIQSILDNMGSSKKVHLIDLRIKNGSHWTILIQALGVRHECCPFELLKITAIGTSKEILEETGKRLSRFAEEMNVPFCFKFVLSELHEIKKDMFQIEADETLAIYSSFCLWSLLAWPGQLENLLHVIKDLKPFLVLINELEASLNSSVFLERFTETLFYFSAVFDCLKITLENRPFRKLTEEVYIREMIRNAIASEGKERIHRYEKASFWLTLLGKFGFVETELSTSALDQARFLFERSGFGKFFSIEMDSKCLMAGWKGTPLEFVSVFKLQ